MPYALALAFLLASFVAYLRTAARAPARLPVAALALYAASLAARPVALGFPAGAGGDRPLAARAASACEPVHGVAVCRAGSCRRRHRERGAHTGRQRHTVALPAAIGGGGAVRLPLAHHRARLADAARRPACRSGGQARHRRHGVVGARSDVPRGVDLAPSMAGARSGVGRVPRAARPCGGARAQAALQATADRYTYLPGVVVAIAVAVAGARWASARKDRIITAAVVVMSLLTASALAARNVLMPWSDSVALWTRVVALDPRHDVGLYNLGAALAEAGRDDEAAARYREVLALQPDHADAKANLDRLDAARLEREGNGLAARGDLVTAVGALPAGHRSRSAPHAFAGGPGHGARHARPLCGSVAGAARSGSARHRRPCGAERSRRPAPPVGTIARGANGIRDCMAGHPNDVGLAHNLARLLATAVRPIAKTRRWPCGWPTRSSRPPGGRDPRAMETLAAALALNDRPAEAIAVNARAAALATAQGDRDLAVQITARGRAYRRPGQ